MGVKMLTAYNGTHQEFNRAVGRLHGKHIAAVMTGYADGENVIIPINPSPELAQEQWNMRNLIQYKYCLPIHFSHRQNCFILPAFSAFKYYKLVIDNLLTSPAIEKRWERLRDETFDSKIKLYAAGAIERSPDKGVGSRRAIAKALKGQKVRIVNPCDFDFNKDDANQHVSMTEFKKTHSFGELWIHSHQVVTGDVNAVFECDAIVLWADQYLGVGSTSEATLAQAIAKPVYVVPAPDFDIKKEINAWLLGCTTRFFDSLEDFTNFVADIT
jgi:hypothetical protein